MANIPNIKNHHAKSYRKRHLSALAISLLLFGFTVLQLGILQGINKPQPAPAAYLTRHNPVTHIKSSYGYSFDADANVFTVNFTDTKTVVKPKTGQVDRSDAAATLSVEVTPNETTAAIPMVSPKGFAVTTVSSSNDTIGGAAATKTVYKYTPSFAGEPSYAISWTGNSNGHAFAVTLTGLLSTNPPVSMQPIFETLNIASNASVKGASISLLPQKVAADPSKLDPMYLSDAVSPAVVKIYHLICGALIVNGQALTDDTCTGFTGSGFLVTSDGYVATNGHVVVYGAQDALVDILTNNPAALTAFLQGLNLDASQIQQVSSNPVVLASIIAKIYDIPSSQLHLDNQKAVTLVATGSSPPAITTLTSSADIARYQHDTDEVKQAKIVGFNYNAKDKLTAIADPTKGFSASDVALLKINVHNAPTIAISNTKVTQNQKVFLVGFPGDADNELTDNTQLSVSVTDGVISSIRQAAGKNGLLYQSDADASHGNSGGPAIDESGQAIGLLTYRAAGDDSGNAAKSYIRDVQDFSDLAAQLTVPINSASTTQQLWQEGLDLYAHNHYVAALKDFIAVKDAYPAQRLIDSYITSSQTAIDNGKNVRQIPLSALVSSIVVSFSLAAACVWLIIRHHGRYQIYKLFHEDSGVPHPHPVH